MREFLPVASAASRHGIRGLDQDPQGGVGASVDHSQEAIDAALCWKWIDAVTEGLDERSFVQWYTPRGKKSVWSQINVENVERWIGEDRMTEHRLAQVEAVNAHGRWDREMLGKLSAQNRVALSFGCTR